MLHARFKKHTLVGESLRRGAGASAAPEIVTLSNGCETSMWGSGRAAAAGVRRRAGGVSRERKHHAAKDPLRRAAGARRAPHLGAHWQAMAMIHGVVQQLPARLGRPGAGACDTVEPAGASQGPGSSCTAA